MLLGLQSRLNVGVFSGERVSYPSPSGFTLATGITPTSYYALQDASGQATDSAGTNHLTTVTGSPAFRYAVSGAIGVDYTAAANTGHSANVNDPALLSCIVGAVGTWGTTFAATQPGITGRISTTTVPCLSMYRATDSVNYPAALIKGATTGSLLLADVAIDVVNPRRPVLYLLQIDRAATTARFLVADSTKMLTTQSGSIATHDTFSGGVAPNYYIGGGTGAIFKGGFQCSLDFYATGVQCEGANTLVNLAKRLGFGE